MNNQTNDLTKEQAIEALKAGKKVTHRYFTDNEYIYLENNQVISEDDVIHGTLDAFFEIRKNQGWDNDYSIFIEQK